MRETSLRAIREATRLELVHARAEIASRRNETFGNSVLIEVADEWLAAIDAELEKRGEPT